ncbi:MAG TPA: TIR domain-containing protein [Anaerolineales bacterium]|nr:TIR domain-containing protein [Anaerolineales bacterium]
MAQVFTSYSRRDTETVDTIVGRMTEAGIDVWIDREDIKAGNTWRVQIVEAIDTCAAFVLILSPNSAASDNVRREIDLSQDSGCTIFPLMLEPVKIPAAIRYQLAGLQFIDVKMLGFDNAVSQLIETLKEHIAKLEPAPEPEIRQVELVIQGIDLNAFTAEKQAELLDFLSKLTSADRSQLQIANMAAGSVRVFVDMPARAAFELKTLALNQDERFKDARISALRLAGNKNYVHTGSGQMLPMANIGLFMSLWLGLPALFSSVVGATIGKILTIAAAVLVLAGIGLALPREAAPPVVTPLPPTTVIVEASTSTPTPVPVSTDTPTLVLTPTGTATASQTATVTSTPAPAYQTLRGTVIAERVNCRYGPGEAYLYREGYRLGTEMEFYGRMEIRSGEATATWLYGLADFYQASCWVNARNIQLDGDVSSLEPDYYPEKAPPPYVNHPDYPPVENVFAARSGDLVNIYWTGYELALGDRESPNSPQYLVEAWTCQAGELVFTPIGAFGESVQVRDEAGCAEPSRGQVFIAHVDGYIGPVIIPLWPAHATPTP